MSKQKAVKEIERIIAENRLTREDLSQIFYDASPTKRTTGDTLSKTFAYLGGILFFSGIMAFLSMFWADLGSAARVILSLGSGFTAYILALIACTDKRLGHVTTALVIIAAALQTSGLFVLLDEFFPGPVDFESCILVFGALFIQQLCTFLAKQRTSFLFFAILFGSILFGSIGEYFTIDYELILLALGLALLSLAFTAQITVHRPIACWLHFFGSFFVLFAAFDLLKGTPLELIFLGLNATVIYLSTIAKSRTLLATGTVSLFSYIAYFTVDNFVASAGWPISLMALGLIFFGLSAFAMKLKREYL